MASNEWADINEIFGRRIEVKKLRPNVEIPRYETERSAGFDLATADDVIFHGPGEIQLVPTGLVIATPTDHMLLITFRSSTPLRHGVTVLTGIVDSDYCGDEDEIKLQVQNLKLAPMNFIPAGTRIAQGVFLPVTRPQLMEVEEMGASRGGFGSTG